jgi:hypothetical protein
MSITSLFEASLFSPVPEDLVDGDSCTAVGIMRCVLRVLTTVSANRPLALVVACAYSYMNLASETLTCLSPSVQKFPLCQESLAYWNLYCHSGDVQLATYCGVGDRKGTPLDGVN